ncbi:MAG: acetyltransferase with multiple hexapeptide repeat domain [Mucilaginibacter sp.]|nr:acetyltransferase with multiple hexapeptide repeat domain [Mucilaginibacter sp.]
MRLIYRIYFKIERIIEHQRMTSLKKSLKYCGKNVLLYSTCYVIMPQKMEIDDNSSIAPYTTVFATYGVKIGKNCLISSNCGISSYNHIQNSYDRFKNKDEDFRFSRPVIIGDNVWIGMNSCILPGVKIGNNSIIGSGSVVTKDIPENEIWVGNPAKFMKKINIDN